MLSAHLVARSLGLTLADLASLIGVTRTTLTAKSAPAALGPLVRILEMVEEMTDDSNHAAIWFRHQPIPGWPGKTAHDLVREGKADKVLAYLEAVRSGVFA